MIAACEERLARGRTGHAQNTTRSSLGTPSPTSSSSSTSTPISLRASRAGRRERRERACSAWQRKAPCGREPWPVRRLAGTEMTI